MRSSLACEQFPARIAFGAAIVFGLQLVGKAEEPAPLKLPAIYSPIHSTEDSAPITFGPGSRDASTTDEIETIRERYDDGKIKIERQVTLDADGNYINHGEWKMMSQSGDVIAEGHYDIGKRIGTWTRWHGRQDSPQLSEVPFDHFKAPFQSQVKFVNDAMEGDWLITDSAQRKCMQVSLAGGRRNGPVVTWLPNGKIFRQAAYERGVPVGEVLEMDNKSGELKTTARYVDGRKVTTKTTYFHRSRQKMTEAMFLAATTVERTPDDFWNVRFAQYGSEGNDLRHGPSKMWFDNGVVQQEGFYQYDKKCGTFTYRYKNGQVAITGEYKDDQPDDVWVWWHENGQKAAIGKYRAGAMLGEWRWWNDDGKLAQQKSFDGTESASSDAQEVIKLGRPPNDRQTTK